MSVYERLNAILSELPAIGKNQKNPQQGFMFRGHDDILNALNPLLAKHGVIVVPHVLERVVSQRQTSKGGVMYEVSLHVQYTFYGRDGDSLVSSTWGEGTDMGDKATTKAMTMAFKNVLNQAFAISSAESVDPDAETPAETQFVAPETSGEKPSTPVDVSPEAPPPATDKPIDKGVLDEIMVTLKLLDGAFPEHPGEGRTWKDVARGHTRDAFGKTTSTDLTLAEGHQLREWLEAQYNEAAKESQVPFG